MKLAGARIAGLLAPELAIVLVCACGASLDTAPHGPSIDVDGAASAPDASSASDAGAETASPLDAGARDAGPPGVNAEAWMPGAIYLTIPDRFFNGDKTNDSAGYPECFDVANTSAFHGGDLAGIRQKIAYLADLGVGAVWATPLYKQTPIRGGACGYHGYWADSFDPDDGAMEPKLGTVAEANALVLDLHGAGIKFILDMVVNHPGRNARIVTERPSWFHDAATCASLGDPEIYCSLSGLPDFRQEDPTVAAYLTAQSRDWVTRVMPDGIRMDTAKHVPASYFASSWAPGVRAARGDLFLVAEVFDEGPYTNFLSVLNSGFDSAFNFPLRRAFVDAFAKGGSVDGVATKIADELTSFGLARTLLQTTLLDNHDVPRFLSEAPAGVLPDDLAVRYGLALTALFTVPGIPQLYYGDELGMIGVYPDNRRDMPDWAWDAAGRGGAHPGYLPSPQATFDLTKTLARLRRENAALYKGYYSELWRQNGQGSNTFAFFRGAADSRIVVVIHAQDAASGVLAMPFQTKGGILPADKAAWPDGTVLEDLLHLGGPATVTVAGGKISVSFTKKGAAIYRAKP